jgi:hypothetical protein
MSEEFRKMNIVEIFKHPYLTRVSANQSSEVEIIESSSEEMEDADTSEFALNLE